MKYKFWPLPTGSLRRIIRLAKVHSELTRGMAAELLTYRYRHGPIIIPAGQTYLEVDLGDTEP